MTALASLPANSASEDEMRGMVASVDQILRWLSAANAGDRMLYANRYCLPANSQGGAQMRKLMDAGIVTLSRKRSDLHQGEFVFYATRTVRPLADAAPKRVERAKLKAVAAVVPDSEAAAIDALFPVIERAARFGRPCPTDAQLAARTGLRKDAIAPTLAAMSAIHLIRIQPIGAPTARLVTIVATGQRTGILG